MSTQDTASGTLLANASSQSQPAAAAARVDLSAIRARLAGRTGQAYWRSLDELSRTPEFQASVLSEFPSAAEALAPGAGHGESDGEADDGASRRTFLKVMGASLAMAGLTTGCARPAREKIVPYVNPPEDVIPGVPLFFATTMPINGYAHGVVVESHEGRPTKVEGNPEHPAVLGASNVLMQASVLDMYDPDRAKAVRFGEGDSTWGSFVNTLRQRLIPKQGDGTGIRLLTGTITSPTFAAQLKELKKTFPNLRRHVYEPIDRRHVAGRGGGAPGQVVYDFSKADVILSLDSDFMWELPGSVRYARQFIDGRRRNPNDRPQEHKMNRLYVVESAMTLTGSMADHRKGVKPSQVEQVARVIASRLGVGSAGAADAGSAELPAGLEAFVAAVVDDLRKPLSDMNEANRPKQPSGRATLVVPGEFASPAVQALAHEMNVLLGNVGMTVTYVEPIEVPADGTLEELLDDMNSGTVDLLLILGPNPVYDAPGDLRTAFAHTLERFSNARTKEGGWANLTARLGSHFDETSFVCQWHVPESHYLESWGDARAFNGTASIIQPLIIPLYGSKSIWEMMEMLLGRDGRSDLEIVRNHWLGQRPKDFETNWRKWLKSGIIEDTAARPIQGNGAAGGGSTSRPAEASTIAAGQGGWEITFRPDYSVWDGRHANNSWLQELPRPFTKLVWDNAALISVRSAEELGIGDGGFVEIELPAPRKHMRMSLPVVIVPGTPDRTLTLHLGYDRTRCGNVGYGVGFDVYSIRLASNPNAIAGASVVNAHHNTILVMTRSHHAMAALPGYKVQQETGVLKPKAIEHPGEDDVDLETSNRKIVRTANLEDFLLDPHWATRLGGEVEMKAKGIDPAPAEPGHPRRVSLNSMYPTPEEGGWDYSHGFQWAMQIDTTACIGCNACVIACQSENNIAVVGKEECGRQREMHWIRIDDWFGDQPGSYGQLADGHVGHVTDPLDDPQVTHEPVPCMHCENAPCELVCPVGATVHSPEGLNEMVYNRCVGTRYCSNNCPYKVRRFNFFLFSDYWNASRRLQYNPDVTVRSRGVMEKCTYCVQRLTETRITIEKMEVRYGDRIQKAIDANDPQRAQQLRERIAQERKALKDGVQTACQQACPTEAIVFGDKNDPSSKVTKFRKDALDYALLEDLTTKPRTRYMARLRNPNPRLLARGASSDSPTTQSASAGATARAKGGRDA